MPLNIHAEPCMSQDLRPGELFSTLGPSYWGKFVKVGGWQHGRDPWLLGEKVYIRTDAPCPAHQRDVRVYRIIIRTE